MDTKKAIFTTAIIITLALVIPPETHSIEEDLEAETELELQINEDGTYKLMTDAVLEEFPEEFLMMENLNIGTELDTTLDNNLIIEISTVGKLVEEDDIGLRLLNTFLLETIPGDISDQIPEEYHSIIEQFLPYDLEELDEFPVNALGLLNVGLARDMVEDQLSEEIVGQTFEELIDQFELDEDIPEELHSLIPNFKVQEISIASYDWTFEPPELLMDVNLELGPDENFHRIKRNLPINANFNYLSQLNEDPKASLEVESEAPLPGYKENEAWKIELPKEINQILDDLGYWERDEEITFRLIIPENSELLKLPEGHMEIGDGTYEWHGQEGRNAIESISRGEDFEIIMEERDTSILGIPIFGWIGITIGIIIILIAFYLKKRENKEKIKDSEKPVGESEKKANSDTKKQENENPKDKKEE